MLCAPGSDARGQLRSPLQSAYGAVALNLHVRTNTNTMTNANTQELLRRPYAGNVILGPHCYPPSVTGGESARESVGLIMACASRPGGHTKLSS